MRSKSAAIRGIALCVFSAIVLSRCGGSNYSSSPTAPTPTPTPTTTPTPPPTAGSTATTIAILGDRGAQSFNPNPATVTQGQMLVFRNTDNTTHHIVFNDNSFDTGNITAGASSAERAMPTNGANYHCTIHPGMIGSITGTAGQPPPACTGPYC